MQQETSVCKKCGGTNIKFIVQLTISAPIKYARQLSKKAIASGDITLWGAAWDKMTVFCADCYARNHQEAEQ